jgi:C1A family cysteine protease
MKIFFLLSLFLEITRGFSENHCMKMRDLEVSDTECTLFEHILTNSNYDYLIPESIDWREEGVVTPIKNQGHCGSCWTFSATGAMEGAYAIYSGILKSFSEQQLLDCVKKDNGCNGGEMIDAFEYVSKNLVCSEDEDPYKAKDGKCITCDSPIEFTGCKIIRSKRSCSFYGSCICRNSSRSTYI